MLIVTNAYAWLVVHSFYHELCEITRLEDVARVKVCFRRKGKLLLRCFAFLNVRYTLSVKIIQYFRVLQNLFLVNILLLNFFKYIFIGLIVIFFIK